MILLFLSSSSIFLSVVERGHTGEDLALEQLERGSTAGRDVGHLRREASLLYGSNGVSAANDGGAPAGGDLREGLRDRECSPGKRLVLEHAHGAVPHHGLALLTGNKAYFRVGRGGGGERAAGKS